MTELWQQNSPEHFMLLSTTTLIEMWIEQQKWIEVFSVIPNWLKKYPVEKGNQKHFVKNVLASYSVSKHTDYRKQNDIYKSIATDDSTKVP